MYNKHKAVYVLVTYAFDCMLDPIFDIPVLVSV